MPLPSIVLLDAYTMNPGDLSWSALRELGDLTIYERSRPEEVIERALSADILIINKIQLDRPTLDQLPQLKCVCLSATGYNNVDIAAAGEKGIPVCNVAGYSSTSVAQHVFALLLHLNNHIALHNADVQTGGWVNAPDWSYSLAPLTELHRQTMGIYGFGRIGQATATIAQGFGMRVLAVHKHPERDRRDGVQFVDQATLLRESDVLSLHVPLNEGTAGLINEQSLGQMKNTAVLVNTGRGGLIVEEDLRTALIDGQIAAACLDVLSEEPPQEGHPLIGLPNCIISPHHAWASTAARQRLLRSIEENIAVFLEGKRKSVVNETYLN